jgi:hypothetical protein
MDRSPRATAVIVTAALTAFSVHCGSRTGILGTTFDSAFDGGADAISSFDTGAPDASAPSCVPAPPGGTTLGGLPGEVFYTAVAVAGPTVYVATTAEGLKSSVEVGSIFRGPAAGGPTEAIVAPEYIFGNLASDGARLYYLQMTGRDEGGGSSIYDVLGLASVDLATGTVQSIAALGPPRSTSSLTNSYMIATTSSRPGVFWIGSPTGEQAASTLYAWDPASDAITTLATGESLSGVAADATGVYWADTGGGEGINVYRRALAGGETSTLATVAGGKFGQLLGVSSDDVVFVSDYLTGSIETVSKKGGRVTHLVSATSAWVNDYAAVDDTYLYWVEDDAQSTLKRVLVTGGAPEIVPTKGDIQAVAFDACNAYIASTNLPEVSVRRK